MKTNPKFGLCLSTACSMFWPRFCTLATFLVLSFQAHSETVVQAWERRYGYDGGGSGDQATKVATDASGNVIVAGSSDARMQIIKYSGIGVPLWTNRYNGPVATCVAVDNTGNVIVTTADFATLKYSSAGVPLWTNRHSGSANAAVVDGNGDVFVTGYSSGTGSGLDYTTVAYSSTGIPLWTNRYNGPGNADDQGNALAVNSSGNVIVTGFSRGITSGLDYATIAYSAAGVPGWTNRYDGPASGEDQALAIAVDASGRVFVTGSSSGSGSGFDYATVAYSVVGVPLWIDRYDGPISRDDLAQAIVVDSNGSVIVTGGSDRNIVSAGQTVTNAGYATIKYSGAGVPIWTNRDQLSGHAYVVAVDGSGDIFVKGSSIIKYSAAGVPLWTNSTGSAGNGMAGSMAADSSGNVFVTGWYGFVSHGIPNSWATVAYSASGAQLWLNFYDGPAPGNDRANAVTVDGSGNVFVTGSSANRENDESATIKYSDGGVPLWTNRHARSANALVVDGSGNVLVSGSTTIKYSNSGELLWTNRYADAYNNDLGDDMAVDGSGNVIVVGTLRVGLSNEDYHYDYGTIKYSSLGIPLWTNFLNGASNHWNVAKAVAVDVSGNVFVTGYLRRYLSYYNDDDYLTVAYSAAGAPMWTNRYNGSTGTGDEPAAIAVDSSGNVFVTGFARENGSGYDYVTIKYSGSGVPLWTNRYNGTGNNTDRATAMAVDSSGNVIVSGYSWGGDITGSDYATVKYSDNGVPLWTNRYHKTGAGLGTLQGDTPSAVAVDCAGNIFVTGNVGTIKYSSAGVPFWTNGVVGAALAVGSGGAFFVAGAIWPGPSFAPQPPDYFTAKFVSQPEIAIQPLTAGSPQVNLNLSGSPASSWTIQRGLGFNGPWTRLGTVSIGTNGSAQFQDMNPPHPAGFYRAGQP